MKIIVFNQYYPPDTSATAQCLSDLCEGLAINHRVTVICGRPSYDILPGQASQAMSQHRHGVHVIRVPSTTFHRSRMTGRISNYLTYVGASVFYGLFQRRVNLVVAMTDPPVIALFVWVVSLLKGIPFVYIIQDLYPDVAVSLGRLKSPIIISILDSLNSFLFRKADCLVAISRSMRDKLLRKGAVLEKIAVIPNWADTKVLTPHPKENPFSLANGLSSRFVVMHSGNIGLSQNLELLLQAAKRLEGLKDLAIVIIGDGAGKSSLVGLASELGLGNVYFFPYQPAEKMIYSFATADIFVISLAAGLDGFIAPSKVFAIMASGRPFIAAIDKTSEVARIAEEFNCGLVVSPDDPEALSQAIRRAYESQSELAKMGYRARKAVERFYSKDAGIEKYGELFCALLVSSGAESA